MVCPVVLEPNLEKLGPGVKSRSDVSDTALLVVIEAVYSSRVRLSVFLSRVDKAF